jgi:hypothetical protein
LLPVLVVDGWAQTSVSVLSNLEGVWGVVGVGVLGVGVWLRVGVGWERGGGGDSAEF